MNRDAIRILGLAVVLTAAPGSFFGGLALGRTDLFCMLAGSVLFVAAILKNGWSQPLSALALLITSNLGFWIFYGLLYLRLQLVAPTPQGGIDPAAGVVAYWMLLLALLSVYEVAVFLRGAILGHQRRASLAGLAGLIGQYLTSMGLAWRVVQGV